MSNNCSEGTKLNGSTCAVNTKARICSDAAKFVEKEMNLPPKIAIIACEGGCIKGEVARVAANILAYRLERDKAVRICLGDAATGNSGMVELVKRAPFVLAIEGCPLQCGTEIMKTRIPNLDTIVIDASSIFSYDKSRYFEILDMPRDEIEEHAQKVTEEIRSKYFSGKVPWGQGEDCCNSNSCCE